ncbi:DegT/DnrJ/EryC1/StrS family aminotransferase [Paenibacillus caui]|uniref:DegT/DnrJ/EryC1/StrS family aminotransferase n=1 Tax=Paenibacillus caui TaxID=2873927 RepID=UPI001CA837FF|nr:DegT/DnrJ/EryC1/StrS family aminotransferase [Paenibacillus caui]
MLNGKEEEYVMDAVTSTWISSTGAYIDRFERMFAEFCGTTYAVSCVNGTAALHLALLAHGVQPGDEIIVPTVTFVATANAVTYCGAMPVFVDSQPDTWNIDPAQIEEKISPRTKGIICVSLYGHPADMEPVLRIAAKRGLFVIEDAAEAFGAMYQGKRVGSIGHSAIFSFYGNKIISTGEGGMVVTNDERIAKAARMYRGQGSDGERKYWFPEVGYNYRMTNVAAAIGCAQLERAEWHIDRRRRIASWYREQLEGCPLVQLPVQKEGTFNVYWLFSVVLHEYTEDRRQKLMDRLSERGIETRPFFYPLHILPPYRHLQPLRDFPVANRICAQGINLPTYAALREEDVTDICGCLIELLENDQSDERGAS